MTSRSNPGAGLPQAAGLHLLIAQLELAVPLPAVKSEIVAGARKTTAFDNSVLEQYPRSYLPRTMADQIRFALRYEPVDLGVYNALFKKLDPAVLQEWVAAEPHGIFARRAWYLYESLTGKRLAVADLTSGRYVDLLDPEMHVTGPTTYVRRQRINSNLIGTPEYSPLVRKTERLKQLAAADLQRQAQQLVEGTDPALLARAVHYLYTKETKSSFAIEGEDPTTDRTERFVISLQQAGNFNTADKGAFVQLQNAIVDPRYAQQDWRRNQNYVGATQRNYTEYVHYICPKPDDLPRLMEGWMRMAERLEAAASVEPVCAAALEAFGFVYIHPFEDGNGRIHRFLVHHVLSKRGFTPSNIIFPISAAMLRDRARYDAVLSTVSKPIKAFVDFELDDQGRMTVKNETVDFYRYFDATEHCEYLYKCIEEAIQRDLKEELGFLKSFETAMRRLLEIVDMPNRRASILIKLIQQNGGRLSKYKRDQFPELKDEEVGRIEKAITQAFADLS